MIRVEEIAETHLGCRVVFKRPASETSARSAISGKLISVSPARMPNGKPGFMISIDYNGEGDRDSFGPVPANFPIDVQHKWRERHRPEYERVSPFPEAVKRVRVMFLGGTMDGHKEDIPVEEFHSTRIYRQEPGDEDVTLVFEQHLPLQQIKGGLWWGKWRLIRSSDPRKIASGGKWETEYNWGD